MQNFLLMFSRWFQIMQIRQRHHVLSDYSQKKSVIFLFSSMNQAKAHKYEFEHFIYEQESLREFYRGHFVNHLHRQHLLIVNQVHLSSSSETQGQIRGRGKV